MQASVTREEIEAFVKEKFNEAFNGMDACDAAIEAVIEKVVEWTAEKATDVQ